MNELRGERMCYLIDWQMGSIYKEFIHSSSEHLISLVSGYGVSHLVDSKTPKEDYQD